MRTTSKAPRSTIALGTTSALAVMTLLSGPALAAPPEQPGRSGQHGHGAPGQPGKSGEEHGKPAGQAGKAGQHKTGGQGGHDPVGNNGTVKIAPLGDLDEIPNNSPHQGCAFTVQWYGFDEGDYYSDVDFALHAPTATGRTLSGDEPSRVFVGEDAAGGAGQDMDAEQVYTLDFTGAPHPQQGYHVKLTVHTPFSQGSDKKSKVFWVEGCEDSSTSSDTPGSTPTVAPAESVPPSTSGENPGGTAGAGTDSPSTTPTVAPTESVLPVGQAGPSSSPADEVAPGQGVPTAVDAGQAGQSPVGDAGNWLLALMGGLAASAGAALGLNARRRGTHQS